MPTLAERTELYARFDRLTRVPMLVLAVAFAALLLLPLLFDLAQETDDLLEAVSLFIWGAFVVEFTVKLYLAPQRLRWLRDNWVDLLIILLPMFRPLRLLRVALLAVKVTMGARRVLLGYGAAYTLAVGMGLVAIAAVAVTYVERAAETANIKDLADGLWWAVTTITTVGYGDRFPVTPEGRAIAAVLMVMGITLFGALTASLAAFMVERREENTLDVKLDEVLARLERLERGQNAERGVQP